MPLELGRIGALNHFIDDIFNAMWTYYIWWFAHGLRLSHNLTILCILRYDNYIFSGILLGQYMDEPCYMETKNLQAKWEIYTPFNVLETHVIVPQDNAHFNAWQIEKSM